MPANSLGVPTVSIVMPCLNQRKFLPEAVDSVLQQSKIDVELLVLDPGSTDGSRQWLESIQAKYPERLRLVFEKDRGQSDAVNKGLSMARGPILGWLNSDDRLRPSTLETVVANLRPGMPEWLYGRCGVIDAEGRPAANAITVYKNLRGWTFSRFKLLQENFISQMAVFWTREMWDIAGGLDLERHLDMDYDLWLRFSSVTKPKVIKEYLADFRVHVAAKGTVDASRQLDAAFQTAKMHARGLGRRGSIALVIHRLLSKRTELAYRYIKPKR
ncbi:MAG: glycosyltransferase [Myxococcales bacterium]|nr:glycosyltransferase [Myxococcales bacterium]